MKELEIPAFTRPALYPHIVTTLLASPTFVPSVYILAPVVLFPGANAPRLLSARLSVYVVVVLFEIVATYCARYGHGAFATVL